MPTKKGKPESEDEEVRRARLIALAVAATNLSTDDKETSKFRDNTQAKLIADFQKRKSQVKSPQPQVIPRGGEVVPTKQQASNPSNGPPSQEKKTSIISESKEDSKKSSQEQPKQVSKQIPSVKVQSEKHREPSPLQNGETRTQEEPKPPTSANLVETKASGVESEAKKSPTTAQSDQKSKQPVSTNTETHSVPETRKEKKSETASQHSQENGADPLSGKANQGTRKAHQDVDHKERTQEKAHVPSKVAVRPSVVESQASTSSNASKEIMVGVTNAVVGLTAGVTGFVGLTEAAVKSTEAALEKSGEMVKSKSSPAMAKLSTEFAVKDKKKEVQPRKKVSPVESPSPSQPKQKDTLETNAQPPTTSQVALASTPTKKTQPVWEAALLLLDQPWSLRQHNLYLVVALVNLALLYTYVGGTFRDLLMAAVVVNATIVRFATQEDAQAVVGRERLLSREPITPRTVGSISIKEEDMTLTPRAGDSQAATLPTPKSIIIDEHEGIKILRQRHPEATTAEIHRFLTARDDNVEAGSQLLANYLAWRSEVSLDTVFPAEQSEDDYDDWKLATAGALQHYASSSSGSTADTSAILPRLVSCYSEEGDDDNLCVVVARDGTRVMHVIPGILDLQRASASVYALAVAMYLDRKLSRHSVGKITVAVDVRSGVGWANVAAMDLFPFLKEVAGLLNDYFPERCSRCIIFPLPRAFTLVLRGAKAFLDPDTAKKVEACAGPTNHDSPIPASLGEYFDEAAIEAMEERRVSLFVTE